jgi:threonine aldolase
VALGVEATALAAPADSVSFCLSKGLSAPVGSLLAGPRAFVDRARDIGRSFGAAMRQAGVIAAPGLVALRTMIARLAEDHAHARVLAEALARVPGLAIDLRSVQTNIVNVDTSGLGVDAATFNTHAIARGVRGLPRMGSRLRLVTYRGITRTDVDRAIAVLTAVAGERPWREC